MNVRKKTAREYTLRWRLVLPGIPIDTGTRRGERSLSLAHITEQIAQFGLVRTAITRFDSDQSTALADLPDAARPAFIAAIASERNRAVLVVTSRSDRADRLVSGLSEYLPPDRQARLWPAPDAIPWEQLPVDRDASIRRVRELDAMQAERGSRHIWVTAVNGLMQLVVSPESMQRMTMRLVVGKRQDIKGLYEWAQSVGYETTSIVQEPGTIARRGGIVDIFPPSEDQPVRIDFFGDEIESIRRFDPHTQRSNDRLKSTTLLPPFELPVWNATDVGRQLESLDYGGLRREVADEWSRRRVQLRQGSIPDSLDLLAGYLVPEQTTILDHLPEDVVIVQDQPDAIRLAAAQLELQAIDLARTFRATGELPNGLLQPFAGAERTLGRLQSYLSLSLGASRDDEPETLSGQAIGDPPVFAGNLEKMCGDLKARLSEGWRITIATDQVERLSDILEERDIFPRRDRRGISDAPVPLSPGTVEIQASDLTGGWSWPDHRTAIWTDFEVFGFRKQFRRKGQRTHSENRGFVQSLQAGEFVVHIDHGVAIFNGLIRLETQGIEREYLLLEYQRGDKLYVPVDQSARVTRYSGGGLSPSLNRLGSGEWVRTKRSVKRAVREMAFELIQLYAYRESGEGYAFPHDTRWDHELAESFPFVETVDQANAITAVKADMESPQPMDRLVCGDVGFGKTEIAIRAAFKAANAGRQVAVLVPTTVLALQHYSTFNERLAAFPIRVEMLSRLKTKQEQARILEGLRDGSVDIVIGTHRVVQKDVTFKNLGLAVVDEEQRFGVRQKEFLKQLRSEVDVLTMSATPIPRTLHLSLSGIRDISMIETAPQARLPIRTFVTASSEQLIREVILREIDRGGQIFFVHNRVHDIDVLASRLKKAVPEAHFGVGHGQMDERVLEEVMLGFVRKDFDVLISTTIIESGVDIPNVNTIIIDNADTLGLTQLYQLRGRVGRSSNRAYAYLLHRPHKAMSGEAQERLETIQEATELGAGLRVAMRDLEIRGAGNILGAEQSGHIATVGYELYMRLLSQAVEEVRSGAPSLEDGPVSLDLPITALIPESYVADTELRLGLYRQIAGVETLDRVVQLEDELRDRFGDFPDEVEHLFALIRLRIRSAASGIDSVIEREREIVVRPVETRNIDQHRLERALGGAIRFTPNSLRIRLLDLTIPWQRALDIVLDAVEGSSHGTESRAAD
jgi:transcription-repair coupling factor (superfamily II helicase)